MGCEVSGEYAWLTRGSEKANRIANVVGKPKV
jgi:hypothetical protein